MLLLLLLVWYGGPTHSRHVFKITFSWRSARRRRRWWWWWLFAFVFGLFTFLLWDAALWFDTYMMAASKSKWWNLLQRAFSLSATAQFQLFADRRHGKESIAITRYRCLVDYRFVLNTATLDAQLHISNDIIRVSGLISQARAAVTTFPPFANIPSRRSVDRYSLCRCCVSLCFCWEQLWKCG